MINKSNIIAFIQYLYLQKNKTNAPQSLLDKWNEVPDEDINNQLQNLFTHWQYAPAQQLQVRQEFITAQKPIQNPGKIYPTPSSTIEPAPTKMSYRGLIFGLIFIPFVYVAYQYFLFSNLKNVYAITNNVSVRNDSNKIVARLDLQVPTKTDVPTFETLQASNNDIYEKVIDSTGKLKKYRKVIVGSKNFWEFITGSSKNIGFVNENYVTDSKEEFDQYKSVFGQLAIEESNALELRFRKIIIGSLGFDEALQGKYIMNACTNANKDIKKRFTSILKQEIIPNTRFAVIARLSDGYYYRFYGDLAENSFAKPKKIGFVENPTIESEYLTGEIVFKYLPAKKQFGLYNCNGTSMNYYSEMDSQNRVWYFKEEIAIQTETNFIQDILDTIKNNLPKIDIGL